MPDHQEHVLGTVDGIEIVLRAPDPPTQPGTRLSDIPMTLSDDAGTAYEWRGSQAAGTGTEWDALRHFAPPPPPEATLLTVAIDGADARPYSMSL